MDRSRLNACLIHFGISPQESKESTYAFDQEHQVSLVLGGNKGTWSVDRIVTLELQEDFLVCTQKDKQVYYLSYDSVLGLKVKQAPQSRPAGFGR